MNPKNSGIDPSFPRMPWYPRDFASATRGWPLVAKAVFRELLDAQWDVGGCRVGTLPDDEERLRKMADASGKEWAIAWRYVEPKFPRVDGGRRNARLEQHREVAVREYIGRRKGARTTNEKRWGVVSLSESLTSRSAINRPVARRVADESLPCDSPPPPPPPIKKEAYQGGDLLERVRVRHSSTATPKKAGRVIL
jgi:hypothetical protein